MPRRRLAIVAALLSGCTTSPAPRHPRPALPLPAEFGRAYALPGPVEEDYLVGLDESDRIFRGRLTCCGERPDFHLILPAVTPAPVLICLPILAGGRGLMWYIANDMAQRGFAVVWSNRVYSALRPEQSVVELEALFRRTVIHNRAVLAWARRQEWARPDDCGLLGVSTGGIVGGTMLAVEPALRAGVLILAGGDLPDLLRHSSEGRIRRWRRNRRATDSLSPNEMGLQMRQELLSDPARAAPYVPTGKVFMVTASLDTVVPGRNREVLWEGLGRPERLHLPLLSHYTAVLGIQAILSRADSFLRRHF